MARVAVVTGGAKGIGRAICACVLADGRRMSALYGHDDRAVEAASVELGLKTLRCDVTDPDQRHEAVARIERAWVRSASSSTTQA